MMHRLSPRGAVLAALCAAAAPPLSAQSVAMEQPARPRPASGVAELVIYPDSLDAKPRTLSELLAARVPGVVVQRSSGAAGAGSWVSFRDAAAVEGAFPLLVVDGVRRVPADAGSHADYSRFGVSTFDDVPVEQIERVELLRGPAAAAAYGPAARAGAIVVTTRAPRADRSREARLSLTGGMSQNAASFPRNLAYLDANGDVCAYGAGYTTVTRYTPLEDYRLFRDGSRAAVAAGAALPIGPARFALGTTFDRTRGVISADATDRGAGTLRLDVPLGARASLALSSQAVLRGVALPSDASGSVAYNGITGWAKDCTPASPCLGGFVTSSHGYATFYTPEQLASDGFRERTQHFSNGLALTANVGGVELRTRAGVDHFGLRSHKYRSTSPLPSYLVVPTVEMTRARTRIDVEQQARMDYAAPHLAGSTLLALRAAQGRWDEFSAQPMSSSRSSDREREQEVRAEQRARFLDRADAALGARWTRMSAHVGPDPYPTPKLDPYGSVGVDVGSTGLPGAGVTTLRLRAAGGRISSYDRVFPRVILLMPPGSTAPPLPVRADRSTELEGGFDVGAAAGATHLAVTAFRRAERFEGFGGALVPSTGFGGSADALHRTTRGLETSLDATPIALGAFAWRLAMFATFTKDEARFPGPMIASSAPYALQVLTASGAAMTDWWARPMSWIDANADGRVDVSEIVYDQPTLAGRSRPSRIAGFTSSLSVGAAKLAARLDYRGGHKVLDYARVLQCARAQCPALYDVRVPLAARVAAVGVLAGSGAGFLEPGDALRLADLSLTVVPRWLPTAWGAKPTLTLAARDIRLWSRSNALDDETSLPAPGLHGGPVALPQPLTRSFEIRLSLAP
ncbi:MAG TPA: Plug domain-containing protein [Gemmatimonadaceae bacterium]|nr:Plug domain-containing protein [Gemmatimonadaceae bacterium]